MKLLKLTIVHFLISSSLLAQTDSLKRYGLVINTENGLSIANAHIINMNSKVGTITNSIGYFEIRAAFSDTIHISFISFESASISTNEFIQGNPISIYLNPSSIYMDEILLHKGDWQQFKLEFVETQFSTEQSSEVKLNGVLQYKGVLQPFKPSVASLVTNPITTIYYLTNKKQRQKRRTKRYQAIMQKATYIDD